MNRSKIFKLSTVAASVAFSVGAQAALYNVVEILESETNAYRLNDDTEYYGTAVQPSDLNANCFNSACSAEQYKISAETRNWPEGISYREEVPFALDNGFDYAPYEDYDFDDYCSSHLGYATCDNWASRQFAGYQNELNGRDYNSIAFVEGGNKVSNKNAVINALTNTAEAIGNERTDSRRNQAFAAASLSDPTNPPSAVVSSHAFEADGNYVVGSISYDSNDTTDGFKTFYSQPTVWVNGVAKVLNYGSGGGKGNSNDHFGQGSVRDFHVINGDFFGVGYNTYSDQEMNATVFVAKSADFSAVSSIEVLGATVDDDYTNSVLSAVNQNGIAVGSAKRSKVENGSYNNRLFFVSGVENAATTAPRANFFSGGIFFTGANGTIGSINNFNEVVGSVDLSENREVDGSERSKRGFIYPLNMSGTNADRLDLFQGKAWRLDDLTNGGSTSEANNQFRIIDASDINDAGVISATALKCEGGYDTTDNDSLCQGGKIGAEKLVAVKLIPNSNESDRTISARGFSPDGGDKVERSGGSLGWLALGLLALLGFRRK